MPKAARWATLKNAEGSFTEAQVAALNELVTMDLETAKAWRIKEMLRWVRRAESKQAAKWRLTRFVNEASSLIADIDLLKPVRTALNTRSHFFQPTSVGY
jgi:hypothetical protein